jgi:hypothetical protein
MRPSLQGHYGGADLLLWMHIPTSAGGGAQLTKVGFWIPGVFRSVKLSSGDVDDLERADRNR